MLGNVENEKKMLQYGEECIVTKRAEIDEN